jgi:hypothetical protein
MATTYEAAKAAALKVLGKDAKIPPVTSALKTAGDQVGKAYDAFKKSRTDLEAKVLALQNADSSAKNALKQYGEMLQVADFGLDEDDKEVAKNIEQAQKILSAWADANFDIMDKNIKNLDELDKHLMDISKYNHCECK